MPGSLSIHSHQQRIEAVFARSAALDYNPELLADHAKYLCVLVSGFIEKSLSEIVLEHARRVGAPSLQRFVEINRICNEKPVGMSSSKVTGFIVNSRITKKRMLYNNFRAPGSI